MEQLWRDVGSAIGYVIIGIAFYVAGVIAHAWRRWRRTIPLRERSDRDIAIHEVLTEMRVRLRADRAYVTMFHNGDHFVDNSEILRKSRTHEVDEAGISDESSQFQGILISSVPDEMKLVVDAGPSFSPVTMLPDGRFRRMLEASGVQAIARAAIRRNSRIIGFVGVDFCRSNQQPDEIDLLVHYAGRIEQLLGTTI
jgi:hypothetical protein